MAALATFDASTLRSSSVICGSTRGLRRLTHVSVSPSARRLAVRTRATAAPPKPAAQEAIPNAEAFTKSIVEDESKYIMQTYVRPDIVFTHGEGCKMWDAYGKEYLDFAAGIAVNILGHSDQRWVAAVQEQAGALAHVSNLFHSVPQVTLARKLVENSFADKVFYANSGTEANEAAMKFARKYARVQAGIDPYDPAQEAPHAILSFSNCFHGRTLGSLSLTAKVQYRTPFQPMLPGAVTAPYNDLDATLEAVKDVKLAAVMVEPVQGEGGVHAGQSSFLQGLRQLCDRTGALLIFDEVQCGLGRTGALWAHQHYGVEPDVMTLAKPLAGGLPIGAVLVKQKVADAMAPGDHGSTFAGNPLVCHAANAVLDILLEPSFLAGVEAKGERLRSGLRAALQGNPHVKEVRGMGLINGIQLDQGAGTVCTAARDKGLIVITAGKGDVVRLLPPLIVTDEEIDHAVSVLTDVISQHIV